MTTNTESAVYWDPYRPDFWNDPYPVFGRLREEAPLYYNEQYDFYAMSRFSDVEAAIYQQRCVQLEPWRIHGVHQGQTCTHPTACSSGKTLRFTRCIAVFFTRVFTPKRMNELETKIRDYCVRVSRSARWRRSVRLHHRSRRQMPMRVIGMLLGIPGRGSGSDSRSESMRDCALRPANRWTCRRPLRPARNSKSTSIGAPSIPRTIS